jgi:hypothetical protein
MNRYRPYFYRRVRLFCELPLHIVASSTGISASRVAAIETGRREPNPTEQRLIERFLRDNLRAVLEMDGPVPDWLRPPSRALVEEASRG